MVGQVEDSDTLKHKFLFNHQIQRTQRAAPLIKALGAQNHMKSILVLSSLLCLYACGQSQHIAAFEYKPLPGVNAKLVLVDLVNESGQYSTVHFEYFINNNSSDSIKLTANNVRAKINGVQTAGTKYDSLASVPDAEFEIDKHESEHKLFFIIVGTQTIFHNRIKGII